MSTHSMSSKSEYIPDPSSFIVPIRQETVECRKDTPPEQLRNITEPNSNEHGMGSEAEGEARLFLTPRLNILGYFPIKWLG